ncbi:folylpolyglutamate synthase 1 [Haematobia irritans]|uniref:folylpolyglutamate synthase 1 n=1 Tax=Haematobia irritans TaxID=7368 RepID=UPI003F4FE53F
MLATHVLWRSPFIRRSCTFNLNVCIAGIASSKTNGHIHYQAITTWERSTRKNMLQSFEESVFQNHGKKCISSSNKMDYDKLSGKVVTKHAVGNRKTTQSIVAADMDCEMEMARQQSLSKGSLSLESNSFDRTSQCSTNIDYREQEQQGGLEYEEAVKALNSLQSNAEALRSSLQQQKRLNSLQETEKYLKRSGLTLEDLKSLSYIHVAGTKGKGSTCALTESILRQYGIKTGFFSSPHLVSLTERIRLNGQPISKHKFAKYFWSVYNALKTQQEYENDMPAYFQFLTVLCFHVYLAEKVDVTILEVGIGGELDCTNVIPHAETVGITSLGLEHTKLLGNTLEEIAWQKAGIIKENSTVYTSALQPECLKVLSERAKEKNASLHMVPDFVEYFNKDGTQQKLKESLSKIILLNGSLAMQLAYDWLRRNRSDICHNYKLNQAFLTEKAIMGLLNCNWPGRCQIVKFFNLNIHLDGAHTMESMQVCGEWFANVTQSSTKPKILMFNTTGDRDSKHLLAVLRKCSKFDMICFVPNIASSSKIQNHDTQSILYTQIEQLKRGQIHLQCWQELCQESGEECHSAKTYTSVLSCFQHIRELYADKSQDLDILVTGSIHLIGATILSLNELCKDFRENGHT